MRRLFPACLFLLCLTAPAAAETFVSVAPITVDSRDGEAPPAELVHDLLISCLSRQSGVAVVERADLAAVMAEKSASMTGFHDGKGLPPRLYGVNYVITGSAAMLGGEWLFTLQATDPATAQVVAAHSAMVGPRRIADELCEKVAGPLAEKLVNRLHSGSVSLPTESPKEAETQALLLRGIGFAKSGAHAQAFPVFLKVLDRDPRNQEACYWLAVSYNGAGLSELAQKQAGECLAQFPGHAHKQELKDLLTPPAAGGKP